MYKKINEINPFLNGQTAKDIDLSYIFGELIKDEVVYNVDTKSFWVYNSKFWEEDTGNTFVKKKAKLFAKAMMKYVDKLENTYKNDKNLSKYVTGIKKLGSYNSRETLINDTKSNISVDYTLFDQKLNLFNCQNGTYNFETMEFQSHNAKDYLTKVSNVIYNPNATCKNWEKFINQIMMGDEDKIDYLQRLLAYCITSDTKEEQMYIFYGPSTRNGKSTLVETISYLMGNTKGYSSNAQPDLIAKKKIDNRGPSEDIARLRGTRAVFMSEPPKEMTINSSIVKQFVGGDTVTARMLHKNSFEYVPQFKMIMNTNHLCTIDDATMFYGNKVVVIQFLKHFTEEEQNHNLKRELRDENEISGIFNWILKGHAMYWVLGMKAPAVIKADTNMYARESDKISEFISEFFKQKRGNKIEGAEAYKKYELFCDDKGYIKETKQSFYKCLKVAGIQIDNGKVNGKSCRNRINDYILIDKNVAL